MVSFTVSMHRLKSVAVGCCHSVVCRIMNFVEVLSFQSTRNYAYLYLKGCHSGTIPVLRLWHFLACKWEMLRAAFCIFVVIFDPIFLSDSARQLSAFNV